MNQEELNKKAIDIIKSNIYLTLATNNGELSWIAPVYYSIDEEYNFYFISPKDSIHVSHILKQPKIAFSIFDSHQAEWTWNGIQASWEVSILENDEIDKGLKYYSTTFIDLNHSSFEWDSFYRLFKLKIDKSFILDSELNVDKRVEVFIK